MCVERVAEATAPFQPWTTEVTMTPPGQYRRQPPAHPFGHRHSGIPANGASGVA